MRPPRKPPNPQVGVAKGEKIWMLGFGVGFMCVRVLCVVLSRVFEARARTHTRMHTLQPARTPPPPPRPVTHRCNSIVLRAVRDVRVEHDTWRGIASV